MSETPKYFMYFPGNYRWSAAFVNMLGRGTYGGADISELHKIGRLLEGKRAEDDEAWFDACVKVADEVRGHAERFQAAGHPVSAAAFYLRACHYYQMGERFRTPKDKKALDAYRIAVDCFHQFVGLTDVKIEIVEVPFEGKSLPGYFVHAQNATSARTPCVVFFDGLDVTKEIQYVAGVPDLIKRGISVLVMDGPGTGEAIRFRGLHPAPRLRERRQRLHRFPGEARRRRCRRRSASSPSASAAITRRAAPRSSRALPPASPGARSGTITRCGSGGSRRSSRPRSRCPAITSCGSSAPTASTTRLQRLEPFKLDGVVQKMRCPFLVVHGEDDEQIPLKDAQALYDACGSHGQDAARLHRRGRRRAALPARLSHARLRHHVELVRGQAAAGVVGIDSSARTVGVRLSHLTPSMGRRARVCCSGWRPIATPHPALATIRSAGGDLPLALRAPLGA